MDRQTTILPDEAYEGFEDIYSLENVDISSVRTVKMSEEQQTEPSTYKEQEQMEFDLGSGHREWMKSLRLEEPIIYLNLSYYTAKALGGHGKKTIGDLIAIKDDEWLSLGMGQGHIDETKTKLLEYMGRDGMSQHSYNIDFSSLLRNILSDIEPSKAYLIMQPYKLEQLIDLTLAEKAQLRLLDNSKQKKMQQQILQGLCNTKKSYLITKMNEIIATFIKPWMRRRGDLVMACEIEERFFNVSCDPGITSLILLWIKENFYQNSNFYGDFVHQIDKDVYCSELFTAQNYESIITTAKSFFYASSANYPLEELVSRIEQQYARHWKSFPENFVAQALRLSSSFCVYKSQLNQQMVSLI